MTWIRDIPSCSRFVGAFRIPRLIGFLGVLLTLTHKGSCIQSEEEKLLDDLFEGYNPSARPVINSSNTANVQIMFSLLQIQDLNVKTQILTATGLLILEWTDERLEWAPSEYNLTEVVVEARKLWVPEFAVINGADEIYADYKEFRAIINNTGRIHWEPGGIFKTICQIDITYFPFDDQYCTLMFGAWSYHTNKMNLTNSSDTVNLDSYKPNGEWEMLDTTASRDEFSYDCCPENRFSFTAFKIHMRRRYTFYVMNVILPSMVTSVLLLSIFYCPPSQKVQIGVVVLLSFRIFLLNVTDSIPKTSDHIPLLGIYLTCTMAITTLSMVLTVMVLNLHSVSDRPVPKWMRVLVLEYLAKLFCQCDYNEEKKKKKAKSLHTTNHVKKKKVGHATFNHSLMSLHHLGAEDSDVEQVPIIALNGGVNTSNGEPGCQSTGFVYVRNSGNHTPTRKYSTPKRAPTREVYGDSPAKPDYGKDWQKLAEIVDRLFFWLFLLAIVAISLLLFHPLVKDTTLKPPNG